MSLHNVFYHMNLKYAYEYIDEKRRNVSFDSYIQAFFPDENHYNKKEDNYDSNFAFLQTKPNYCECYMNLQSYINSPLDTPDGSPDLTRKKIEL